MSNTIFPANVRGLTYTVVKSQENSVMVKEASNFLTSRTQQNLNPRWHWSLQYEVLFDDPTNTNPSFSYSDLQVFLGFCQARYGAFDDFLYLDPDDNFVGPGVITATWQRLYPYALGAIILDSGHAQQVISAPGGARSGYSNPGFNIAGGTTTDGGLTWQDLGASSAYPNPHAALQVVTDGTNYYSPVQRHLGGLFWEDITDLNGAITVYNNGSVTGSYTLGFGGISFPGFASNGLYLNWGGTNPVGPITATFNYLFRVRFEDSIQDFENWAKQFWAVGGDQGSSGKGNLKFMSSPFPTGATFSSSTYPPVSPPTPGLQLAILYPSSVALSVNGVAKLTYLLTVGSAAGVAGPNAFFNVQLFHQFFSSSSGNAQFSGYSLPAYVPAGAVKYIYAFNPYVFQSMKNTNTGNFGFATAAIHVPTYAFNPFTYLFSNQPGAFAQVSARIDNLYSGGNLSTFPYNQVTQNFSIVASLQRDYYNEMIGAPLMLVWY